MLKILMIDELTNEEILTANTYLNANAEKAPINDIYWIKLHSDILEKEQLNLEEEVGGFRVAVEIGKKWIKFELLSRSQVLDNKGGGALTNKQFNFILNIYNRLYEYLGKIN
jgi:hypothetical protein